MDTPVPPPPADDAAREAARLARKLLEREKIERGRRQAAAGQVISGDELARWLDMMDRSDGPVPFRAAREP
jgi:predicted transcriptional regulator